MNIVGYRWISFTNTIFFAFFWGGGVKISWHCLFKLSFTHLSSGRAGFLNILPSTISITKKGVPIISGSVRYPLTELD